jgi:hypothetical protein
MRNRSAYPNYPNLLGTKGYVVVVVVVEKQESGDTVGHSHWWVR